MPALNDAFANFRGKKPLTWKLRKAFANSWTKLRNRSRCCGHYGEPGC